MLPGWIISALTFPGVIAHEYGHKFFCNLFRLPVYKVCYFRFGNPAGYVIHQDPGSYIQTFIICVGPFIVNNILAVGAFILASPVFTGYPVTRFIFGWLGCSFAMNSFPSKGDAKGLWTMSIRHPLRNILYNLIGWPFVAIIYVANLLRFIWFDLIWTVFVYAMVEYFLMKIIV